MPSLRIYGFPDGQKRPRAFTTKRGQAIIWSPESHWRICVRDLAYLCRPKPPLAGPLQANVKFFLPRPASAKKSLQYHPTKPDLDNLLKTLFDGLGDARWFAVGDQQIVGLGG